MKDPFLSLSTPGLICAFCDDNFLRLLHENGKKGKQLQDA